MPVMALIMPRPRDMHRRGSDYPARTVRTGLTQPGCHWQAASGPGPAAAAASGPQRPVGSSTSIMASVIAAVAAARPAALGPDSRATRLSQARSELLAACFGWPGLSGYHSRCYEGIMLNL